MRWIGAVLLGGFVGATSASAQSVDPTGAPVPERRDTAVARSSAPERGGLQARWWGKSDAPPTSVRRSVGVSVYASHLFQPRAAYQADSVGFGGAITGELWGTNGLGLRLDLGGELHFGDAFGAVYTSDNGDGTETDALPTYAFRQRYVAGLALELAPWQVLLESEPTILSPYVAVGGGWMHLRESVDVDLETYRGDEFVSLRRGTRSATLSSPYLSVGLGAVTHSDGARIGQWTLPVGVRAELTYTRALRPAHAAQPGLYLASGRRPDALTLSLGLQLAL